MGDGSGRSLVASSLKQTKKTVRWPSLDTKMLKLLASFPYTFQMKSICEVPVIFLLFSRFFLRICWSHSIKKIYSSALFNFWITLKYCFIFKRNEIWREKFLICFRLYYFKRHPKSLRFPLRNLICPGLKSFHKSEFRKATQMQK